MKTENIIKKVGFVGMYSGLCLLVFFVVSFLALYMNTGNVGFVVLSVATLIVFLVLTVKVHYRHRGTVYGLEDLK